MVVARFFSFSLILFGVLFFEDVTSSDDYQLFNKGSEICCHGLIHTISTRNYRCCGKEPYNKENQICCKNVIHPLQTGYICCGNSTYNQNESTCCRGNVRSGAEDVHTCCGDQNMMPKSHICCRPGIVVEKKNPDAHHCCGNVAYVKGTEICCNKTVRVIDGMKSPACCGSDIWDRKDNQKKCCQGKLFDVKKQACCMDRGQKPIIAKILEKKLPYEKCCGMELYNPKMKYCCGNAVVDIPEKGKGICCKNVM